MFRRADDIGELTRMHIGLYDLDGFPINKSNQNKNDNLSLILFQCILEHAFYRYHTLSFLQRSHCRTVGLYLKPRLSPGLDNTFLYRAIVSISE